MLRGTRTELRIPRRNGRVSAKTHLLGPPPLPVYLPSCPVVSAQHTHTAVQMLMCGLLDKIPLLSCLLTSSLSFFPTFCPSSPDKATDHAVDRVMDQPCRQTQSSALTYKPAGDPPTLQLGLILPLPHACSQTTFSEDLATA